MGGGLLSVLIAAVAVTLLLAASVWVLTGRARLAPPGKRLYSRLLASAAATALAFWCLGLVLPLLVYVLVPAPTLPRVSPAAPGLPPAADQTPPQAPPGVGQPPSGPRPGSTPEIARTGQSWAREEPAGSPSVEFEFTEQPELPPALAAVLAQAQARAAGAGVLASAAGGAPVILETGDVVIEAVENDGRVTVLLNRSAHTVSLSGWSLLVRTPGEQGPLWCHFPESLLLLPGERIRVLAGEAARETGLEPGEFREGAYVWTAREIHAGGMVLYDPEGRAASEK